MGDEDERYYRARIRRVIAQVEPDYSIVVKGDKAAAVRAINERIAGDEIIGDWQDTDEVDVYPVTEDDVDEVED